MTVPIIIDGTTINALAHTFVVRECKQQNIKISKKDENITYTKEAQEIFEYYHETICEALNY